MNFPEIGNKLWWAAHRLKKQFSSRAVILMYHSIAEIGSDPWGLRVTPAHFAEHLEIIKKHGTPLSLWQLAETHRQGNIPNRAVIVTFDDGYADNLYEAKPLLENYGVPATVFLTTGQIGSDREFWWDELDRLLLQPGTLPEGLHLSINDNHYQWELGKAASYSEAEYQRQCNQRIQDGEYGFRLALYYSVWQLLLPLLHDVRCKILDELTAWAGVEPMARSTHRVLLYDEIGTLEQGNLIEVGAHTVTHPFLSAHPAPFQWGEIQQSKAHLEEILGHPVISFSYPHGDYTTNTINLIRKAGFTCACSITEESVWPKSDGFQLPRFEVKNWPQKEFAKRLLRWLHH